MRTCVHAPTARSHTHRETRMHAPAQATCCRAGPRQPAGRCREAEAGRRARGWAGQPAAVPSSSSPRIACSPRRLCSACMAAAASGDAVGLAGRGARKWCVMLVGRGSGLQCWCTRTQPWLRRVGAAWWMVCGHAATRAKSSARLALHAGALLHACHSHSITSSAGGLEAYPHGASYSTSQLASRCVSMCARAWVCVCAAWCGRTTCHRAAAHPTALWDPQHPQYPPAHARTSAPTHAGGAALHTRTRPLTIPRPPPPRSVGNCTEAPAAPDPTAAPAPVATLSLVDSEGASGVGVTAAAAVSAMAARTWASAAGSQRRCVDACVRACRALGMAVCTRASVCGQLWLGMQWVGVSLKQNGG